MYLLPIPIVFHGWKNIIRPRIIRFVTLFRYLLAPKTLSSMCTFNEWVWVTTYFILTYFWDERNDIHVDPKAPFPPYTKTLPADMAHSSADTRISLHAKLPSTKLAANNIQTNVTNIIMITRNTAKRWPPNDVVDDPCRNRRM